MVARLLFIITILLCSGASCEKERAALIMSKTPYTGNELRINGYYYSGITSADDIGIAVFYRDGVCIHMYTRPEGQDTLDFIENDILLDNDLMSRLWNTPTNIGVFHINASSIEFETWEAGRDIITFSNFGTILNDSTFVITREVNNDSGESTSLNLTYHFQEFSPKPDSTNTFIK